MKLLWQQIPGTIITEIFCKSKAFDGVVLDAEHGTFNNSDIFSSIQTAKLLNRLAFVRIASIDKKLIQMSLDAGANGIILSTVEDIDNFKYFIKLCSYPPSGIRGQGLVRENDWGQKQFFNRSIWTIPQIETKRGLDISPYIQAIYNGPVLVGPYDLSASLGCVGNFKDEAFVGAINCLKKLFGHNLGFHLVKNTIEDYPDLKNSSFLAFGMDTIFLIDECKRLGDFIEK